MKKYFLIITALLFFICCRNTTRTNIAKQSNIKMGNNCNIDTIDIFSHVFKSKVLQDSLNAFISETKHSTKYDTLVYSVFMHQILKISGNNAYTIERCDTILSFVMSDKIWFSYDEDNSEQNIFYGATIKENKVLGVSSCGNWDASSIFNDNKYDMDIWNRFYFSDLMRHDCDINVFWRCSDSYRVILPDSLTLIKRNRYQL